jgi:hypothetical protein
MSVSSMRLIYLLLVVVGVTFLWALLTALVPLKVVYS